MSTTPTTPNLVPTWITLLINLGANLGASFIKNTQVGQLLATGAATTTAIINEISAAHAAAAAGGTSLANQLVVPLFTTVIQGALAAAVAGGKISASDANELQKALNALATEDTAAKAAVDYTTIGPIAPLR